MSVLRLLLMIGWTLMMTSQAIDFEPLGLDGGGPIQQHIQLEGEYANIPSR